jgi:PAS domain S-box-containing protein
LASFLTLTGYDLKEVLGQSFKFLMARSGDPPATSQIAAAFESSTDSDPEINCCRKDGSEFWAAVFVNPVRDESGAVVQHFVSFVDLSKHKQAQAQARTLIEELNHRVKNTLSTVQSIVWQAFRNSSDVKVIREGVETRLFALSRSHDLLARANWQSAGLVDVVKEALEPFEIAGRAERIVVTGMNIRLPPKVILALGIAFHELATNAVKYGAFSNARGSILIAWTIELKSDGDRLILRWQEKDGPPVRLPIRKGFGSLVIERGLPHELEGSSHLDYRTDGMVCTINIPAPREVHGR